jgi:hypothetical protein
LRKKLEQQRFPWKFHEFSTRTGGCGLLHLFEQRAHRLYHRSILHSRHRKVYKENSSLVAHLRPGRGRGADIVTLCLPLLKLNSALLNN